MTDPPAVPGPLELAALTLDEVVAAHPFKERRRLFRTTLTCEGCGYTESVPNGMFCPTGRALAQADHWAEFAGIRKWRTLEDTERGEVEALKVFVVHHSDIVRCPKVSMSARHYLPSGVCACQLDQQLKALEAREEEGADVAAELAVLRVSRREVVR